MRGISSIRVHKPKHPFKIGEERIHILRWIVSARGRGRQEGMTRRFLYRTQRKIRGYVSPTLLNLKVRL